MFENNNNKDDSNKGFFSRLFGSFGRHGISRMTMRKYMGITLLLLFTVTLSTVAYSCSGVSQEPNSQSNPPAGTMSGETPSPANPGASGEKDWEAHPTATVPSQTGMTAPTVTSTPTVAPTPHTPAEIAIAEASKENKYVFLVFYQQNDPKSDVMKQVAAQAQKELPERANVAYIDYADDNELELIYYYGIDESFLPITLVIAPNGAVVHGFPEPITSDNLTASFVSSKMADIIKASQDQKLVYLYIASSSMKYYQENLDLIQYVADVNLQGNAVVVQIDPQSIEASDVIQAIDLETPAYEPNLYVLIGPFIAQQLSGQIYKQALLDASSTALDMGAQIGTGPQNCEIPGQN